MEALLLYGDKIIPLIETGACPPEMRKHLGGIKKKLKSKFSKCVIGPVDKADMLVSSFFTLVRDS